MKILSSNDMRLADQFTIKNEPISSVDLMERAAGECVEWLKENITEEVGCYHIFCGIGNNGGDGLAIARLLSDIGENVKVYVLRFSENASDDFQNNFERLSSCDITIEDIKNTVIKLDLDPEDVIIDAIFGSGLNKVVSGWLADTIKKINEQDCLTISIDIPSGIFADDNSENNMDSVIKADITLSFQNPKMAFLTETSGRYCGMWEILDIGLDQGFIHGTQGLASVIDSAMITLILKEREKFGHKGSYGHALLIAGSLGKMGASVLASRACLRSGIGLLSIFTPSCGYDIIQNSVPEAMAIVSKGKESIEELPGELDHYSAIGIGPGIGLEIGAVDSLKKLVDRYKLPIVLDADALNILSEEKSHFASIAENSILTPHPGEFKRLVGAWENDKEKLEKQVSFSKKYGVIIVLKGAHTSISDTDGEIYFNSSGNPGMATAGSGDVLLGMITGLLGRGYDPIEAAILGVYLHGLAGDFAASLVGEESLVAGDLIDNIPNAFQMMYE